MILNIFVKQLLILNQPKNQKQTDYEKSITSNHECNHPVPVY